jgi:hypothetical protein
MPSGWDSETYDCEMHVVSTIVKFSYSPLSVLVTGMIWSTLSLQNGYETNRFRKCVQLRIAATVQVVIGTLSPSARSYKLHCIRLFFAQVPPHLVALLLARYTGDWRITKRFVLLVPTGTTISPDLCDKLVAAATDIVLLVCLHRTWKVYPRHRWLGADVSIDEQGKLECLGGLFSSSYELFAAKRSDSVASVLSGEARKVLSICDGGAAAGHNGAGELKLDEVPIFHESHSPEANAKAREKSLIYCRSSPFTLLVVFRQVYEPMRVLATTKIHIASEAWERRQQALVARAKLNGTFSYASRSYRVVEAASNKAEDKALQQLSMLYFCNMMWALLPITSITAETRCLIFRLLSRVGCGIEELLRQTHRTSKFMMFLLLAGTPGILAYLQGRPPCTLCPWARRICDYYSHDFGGAEMMAYLAFRALVICTDMSDIESLHAWIRRLLTTRSAQTHLMSLVDVGSNWLLSRGRKRAASQMTAVGVAPVASKRRPAKKGRAPGKAVKGHWTGGLQRAFFHEHLTGVKFDRADPNGSRRCTFRRLHDKFKTMTDEERVSLGSTASASTGHQGRFAFGIPASICRARAIRAQQQMAFEKIECASDTSRAAIVYEAAVGGGPVAVAGLEGHGRIARAAARTRVASDKKTVAQFCAGETQKLAKLCKRGACGQF